MKKEGTGKKDKKRFTIKLVIGFTTFISFVVVLTSFIVFIPWYYTSTKNIENIVGRINDEIMKGVTGEMGTLFDNSVVILKNIKEIFRKNVIDIYDKSQRENLYLTLLKNNRNLSWIVFGWPNGDFLGAQREFLDGKENLNIVNRKWDRSNKSATKIIDLYYNNEKEKSTRVSYKENYNSTKRSWYKVASQKREHSWTPVYIFATTKQPGINVSMSLERSRKFIGVISIAMELKNISEYLKKIKVGKTGKAFIMNSKKEIIAFEDSKEVISTGDKEGTQVLKLKKLGESTDPFLKIAEEVLVTNNISVAEIDGIKTYKYNKSMRTKNYFVTFLPSDHLDWLVCTIIPESDYLGEINKNIKYLLITLAGLMVVVSVIIFFLSKKIFVTPILKISDEFDLIQKFDLESIKPIPSRIREINILSDGVIKMSQGLISFGKYLPTELVNEMISEGIEAKIGGEERELTVFFSDIASFTKVFEQLGNKLMHQLGEYLNKMSQVVLDNNGAIDKYIGDAIMAFWGAPKPNINHAVDACRTGLASQRILKDMRIDWERDKKPLLYSRIGINTGVVIVGNVGSDNRLNYTVLGDAVNLGSRLEALNKYYGTEILIGEKTYEKVKSEVVARRIDSVAVYGKEKPINVYELIAMKDEIKVTDNFEWLLIYERGLNLYKQREWQKAINYFKKVILIRGKNDPPSKMFIYRCMELIKNPPKDDWDGTIFMRSK